MHGTGTKVSPNFQLSPGRYFIDILPVDSTPYVDFTALNRGTSTLEIILEDYLLARVKVTKISGSSGGASITNDIYEYTSNKTSYLTFKYWDLSFNGIVRIWRLSSTTSMSQTNTNFSFRGGCYGRECNFITSRPVPMKYNNFVFWRMLRTDPYEISNQSLSQGRYELRFLYRGRQNQTVTWLNASLIANGLGGVVLRAYTIFPLMPLLDTSKYDNVSIQSWNPDDTTRTFTTPGSIYAATYAAVPNN